MNLEQVEELGRISRDLIDLGYSLETIGDRASGVLNDRLAARLTQMGETVSELGSRLARVIGAAVDHGLRETQQTLGLVVSAALEVATREPAQATTSQREPQEGGE